MVSYDGTNLDEVRERLVAVLSKGQCPSDWYAPNVLRLLAAGRSYCEVARELDLSKNTVATIAQRSKLAGLPMSMIAPAIF